MSIRKQFCISSLPPCALGQCIHSDLAQVCSFTNCHRQEMFNISYKSGLWMQAVRVMELSIQQYQMPPPSQLLQMLEIIMNVHSYYFADSETVIKACLSNFFILFQTIPPCQCFVRKAYLTFLQMPLKDKNLSDRKNYTCNEGILMYVLCRLKMETGPDARAEPLVYVLEKNQNVKAEMEAIFETLDGKERIHRLMMIITAISQLLSLDLSIWHARHLRHSVLEMMMEDRPLIAHLLWPDIEVAYSGCVSPIVKDIMRLFVSMVTKQQAPKYLPVISQLLNAVVRAFEFCERGSQEFCEAFADDMVQIVKDKPAEVRQAVFGATEPPFMADLVRKKCANIGC